MDRRVTIDIPHTDAERVQPAGMTHAAPRPARPAGDRVRRLGRLFYWLVGLVALGVMIYTATTAAQFVAAGKPPKVTDYFLGAAIDLALIVALWGGRVLGRYGETSKPGAALRWFAGLATLYLNTAQAATDQDWQRVAVHSIGPLALVLLTEAVSDFQVRFTRIADQLDTDEARRRAEAARRAQLAAEQVERDRLAREAEAAQTMPEPVVEEPAPATRQTARKRPAKTVGKVGQPAVEKAATAHRQQHGDWPSAAVLKMATGASESTVTRALRTVRGDGQGDRQTAAQADRQTVGS